MQKLIAMMAFAGLLALPGAMAAYVSTGDLTGALGEIAPVPLDAAPILYLNDDGSIWQESNGFDGLQTEEIVDELGNHLADADTNVAGGDVPAVGAPEIPAVPEVGAPALPELPALPALPQL